MIGGFPDRLRALPCDPIIKNTRIPAPDSKAGILVRTMQRTVCEQWKDVVICIRSSAQSVRVGMTDVKRGVWGLNLRILYADCNMTPNHLSDSLVIITVCRCGELKPGSL